MSELFDAAKAAFERAYTPYSKFNVGAAIRTKSGKVYSGCNVENVAYPEGTCAEAGAIAAMVNGGDLEIAEILVIADSDQWITPCGGCRQKILEFSTPDTPVILARLNGETHETTIGAILPGGFDKSYLGQA